MINNPNKLQVLWPPQLAGQLRQFDVLAAVQIAVSSRRYDVSAADYTKPNDTEALRLEKRNSKWPPRIASEGFSA